jgi:hypothetical protein
MRSGRELLCIPVNSRMFVIKFNRWPCCHNFAIKQTSSIHSPKEQGIDRNGFFIIILLPYVSWTSNINLFKLMKAFNTLKILNCTRGRERLNHILQCVQKLLATRPATFLCATSFRLFLRLNLCRIA